MSARDRTGAAAIEALVGAALFIGGSLVTRVPIALMFGILLMIFGVLVLAHSVALGSGWRASSNARVRNGAVMRSDHAGATTAAITVIVFGRHSARAAPRPPGTRGAGG